MRHAAFALALVGLLACQPPPAKSEPQTEAKPAPTNTSSPTTNPDCDATELEAELRSYCDYDLGVPPLALPRVTWTAETYHPLATRVISLDAAGLTDPEGHGTTSVAAWLQTPPRRLPEPGEMVFAIAADVPGSQVAELFAGLAQAGRQRVRVLVHVGETRAVPQPRDPELLASLRASLPAEANQRVVFVAERMTALAQVCPGIGGVFPNLVQVPPGDRCGRLAQLASAALVGCVCVQLPELMTMLYAMTMGFTPPPGRAAAVELRLDPTQAVALEPGETWEQVVARTLTGPQPRALLLTGG
jgi:hypothetical protein